MPAQGGEARPLTIGSTAESVDWGTLGSNLVLTTEVIARAGGSDVRDDTFTLFAAGLDGRTVLSGGVGDWGVLVFQPYLVRRDDVFAVPNHVEDEDDWELELHQTWFNLTRFGRGRGNVRVGHMLVPFGLEPFVDTHFAVRQLVSAANLGAKMDWGVSWNGAWPGGDFELALLRGSGMEYVDKHDNYAVAGRVGTPYDRNVSLGVSAFVGRVIDPPRLGRYRRGGGLTDLGDDLVRRDRFGLDASIVDGPRTWLAELSAGSDFEQEVVNGLAELGWTSRSGDRLTYLQAVVLAQQGTAGWDEDLAVRLGVRWAAEAGFQLEAQLRRDLERYGGAEEDTALVVQARVGI